MKRISVFLLALFIAFGLSSCHKELDPDPVDPTDPEVSLFDLDIPTDFNYETYSEVTVSFSDFKSTAGGEVKFNIYLYSDVTTSEEVTYESEAGVMVTETIQVSDVLNNLVATVVSTDGNFSLDITVPEYYESLYVIKNNLGVYSSQIVPIVNNKAVIIADEGSLKSAAVDPVDVIYGVNAQKDLFTINPVTGDLVIISTFPSGSGGSVTCALDPINKLLYTIGINSKNLYSYNIVSGEWADLGYTGLSGPRLEYRKEDGLLYFSTGNIVYTLDPIAVKVISTYTVNGLHHTGWGDVAFDAEGTLFMSTLSGLYRCDIGANNTYNAIRISADNLPFNPTSMTFDSNGELWIGSFTSDGKGRVAIMDKVTGGWEYRYENYPIKINDLTFMPLDVTQIVEADIDGDGIIDFYDDYPNDADRAYNVYSPSIYGWGSYAFEDLWPNIGDFDFNDLVINYRYTHVMNGDDLIHETIMDFKIKNVGGSFLNGFGLEINCEPDIIQEITGYNLTEGIVSLNAIGLENNQSKPVIMVFDNAWANININDGEMRIVMHYNVPIRNNQMGSLNPFIFIDGDRGREVHLVDMEPTDLMNTSFFGTTDDDSNPSIGRYYRNETNLPWGISILHDFVYPKEKIAINKGYTKFASWAMSGGSDFADWYKDQDDYRNSTYLIN